MIEKNFKSEAKEPKGKKVTTSVRASAIATLLGLGYSSDTQGWTGMLELVEKGCIYTQDLRRRKL